jgi:RNA polymerase sigma-70 factor, ECF subfamily
VRQQSKGAPVSDHEKMPDNEAREAEFVRLLTRHQLDIYLYVHSLVPDPDEAAEVLQDTNVVLWAKRHQFDSTREFRAWAFQIARYKLLKHRDQRKRKWLSFSDALVEQLALQAPAYTKPDGDLTDDLRRCVTQLAANDRDILNRRYSSMMSCEVIAKAFGRPVRWVYNSLNRIRRELHSCMARYANTRGEP